MICLLQAEDIGHILGRTLPQVIKLQYRVTVPLGCMGDRGKEQKQKD